jgi:hypothetical protein
VKVPQNAEGDSQPRDFRRAIRPAVREDAGAIGAVFDAAVRHGWTYLGDLVEHPIFTAEDWDQLIAEHLPPNLLLVAVDDRERVIGFTAVHPADGEMFLLFVDPEFAVVALDARCSRRRMRPCARRAAERRSCLCTRATPGPWRYMPRRDTGRMELRGSPTFGERAYGNCGS